MTVRIDTARNQIAATVALLTQLGVELEDLHALAYDRPAAAERIKVSGGERDYALDTHGDPKARLVYRALGDAITNACGDIAAAAHGVSQVLRSADEDRPRTRRTISALEVAELIEARARRIARGEYSAVRHLPQPDADRALRASERARTKAEAEADALRRQLDRSRRTIANLRDKRHPR